ncbi:MAG TPA: hypothetical protein VF472_12665 [Burkholderiaceae bacterium]
MKSIRKLHFYLGVFFAPAIFFFALSGALQTFNLHESEDDGSYSAPSWIITIAAIHKDQRLPRPHKHKHEPPAATPVEAAPAGPSAAPAEPPHEEGQGQPHSSFPLKCFVLLLALGLMTSAASGIYIALQGRNNRNMTWIMLGAGLLVPMGLLLF